MMYPGTIFEYIDQSQFEPIPINEPISKPLFMTAFTSDKGPEDYRVVEGDEFFKLYGDSISFAKHGQPLLQAAAIINAGGKLFAKRVVDPAATIGNIAVIANISKVEEQKTNAAGLPIYTDILGNETTEATDPVTSEANTPVMVNKCKIKYSTKTVPNVTNIDDVATSVLGSATEPSIDGTGDYPLFVIADVGRGLSNKYIQITPDYTSSKSVDYTLYMFKVIENNKNMENIQFAFNPDIIDNNINTSMDARLKANALQVQSVQFDEETHAFMQAIATIAGLDIETVANMDILFGKTRKGEAISTITVDIDGINLSHPYGLRLESGADGSFVGNRIYDLPLYETEMAKVFDGTFDSKIYDLDNYKIDIIADANYPAAVKRAIENFVTFREDCFYFRDQGLGLNTLAQILAAEENSMKNKFCASYLTTYDILDPYSKKQVKVTMMYTLAKLLVNHFSNGRNRPLAGQLHDMILTDAIEGTVNFIPAITPAENQKDILGEARINYASYYDTLLVIDTLYTSQEKTSQFSFINNILAIQEVIKAVRTRCPKTRYSFMDGDDLEKYKEDVQTVIDKYSGNFIELTLEYISDATYISNKIFYAAIKAKFRNFIQTEYFKVIALPS